MIKISNKVRKTIIYIFIIFVILFAYFKIKFIREIIFVILTSFILSYALKPIYKIIISKVKINTKVIAASLIVGIIGAFIGLAAILIPKIFNESIDLGIIFDSVEIFMNNIITHIQIPNSDIMTILTNQFVEKFNIFVVEYSMKIFDGIINFSENIIALAVIPVVAYYFLAYGDYIYKKIMFFLPLNRRSVIKNLGKDIDRVLGKYILGQLILSLIVGILTFIAMMIIGIRFSLILSILNGILNIVPYFGAILGIIPAILVALLDGPIKAIWVVIAFIIIQQIEGNIIAPQITASSIEMHPLTIIILLLIGDKFGGLIGMILIIPLAVVIKVLYEDIDYYSF